MTRIFKALVRETDVAVNRTPVIIEVHGRDIVLRLKAKRRRVVLSIERLYRDAIREQDEANRRRLATLARRSA